MGRVALLALSMFTCVCGFSGCGAGIAPEPAEPQTQQSGLGDDGAGCRKERPVGSNIEREVCRTPEEVRRDREEARKLMIPPRISPTGP